MDFIYLDNAATTPVAEKAMEAMLPWFREEYGNPSSSHAGGTRAATAIKTARAQVATLLGAESPEEIIFTSGGTESNNWAILSTLQASPKKHFITCATEHPAVLSPGEYAQANLGCRLTVLPVDSEGRLDPETLRAAIRDDTSLVSVMLANNEVGTLNPIAELAEICQKNEVRFHTDAVQAVGKLPVDVQALGVDMLSFSGHKLHGPKGIGGLYIRRGIKLQNYIYGGSQERGKRAGTSNVAGIVGLGKAAELAGEHLEAEYARQTALIDNLWADLQAVLPDIQRNGAVTNRHPGILNMSIPGAGGAEMLLHLERRGILVSTGSACSTGVMKPSRVLLALGIDPALAQNCLRISLGRETSEDDLKEFAAILPEVVEKCRALGTA